MSAVRMTANRPVMKKHSDESKKRPIESALTPEIDLLYQTLESEMSGMKVYATALGCVQRETLRVEWEKRSKQTHKHVEIVRRLLADLGLDPHRESVGRQIVRHIGNALVDAMQMALRSRVPAAAEIVAAECVLVAETKDHANWSLIGCLFGNGLVEGTLKAAYDEVAPQKIEQLDRARIWSRELWLAAMGRRDAHGPDGESHGASSTEFSEKPRDGGSAARDSTRGRPRE